MLPLNCHHVEEGECQSCPDAFFMNQTYSDCDLGTPDVENNCANWNQMEGICEECFIGYYENFETSPSSCTQWVPNCRAY